MPSRIVKLSRASYALWWVVLLFVHAVAAAFFGFCAHFYQFILGKEDSYLAGCLASANIGMQADAYPMIAVLQGLVALPHSLVILRMLTASLYSRSFAFMVEPRDFKALIYRLFCPRKAVAEVPSSNQKQKHFLTTAWRRPNWMSALFGRTGLLGVDGKYFHFILFCRETFEMSLQTNQAYRMSYYLPRDALNRFYVILIVLNCWSTPLILRLYKHDEAKKRLLCLICDCVLDSVAAIVIPCSVIVTYVGDFDMELEAFPMELWYNDIWNMHAISESQILFVTSWRDLATRMVFSIGMIIAMSNIKDLLGPRQVSHARGNQVIGMELINPDAKAPGPKHHSEKQAASTFAPTANDILATTSLRMATSRVISTRLASIQNRLHTC